MQMMHYLMKYALICIYFQNTLDIFLYHSIQETVGSQEEGKNNLFFTMFLEIKC